MSDPDAEDARRYLVVVNQEDQYSLWLEQKPLPAGWRAAGGAGTKAECLDFVEAVWKDMTPASRRRRPPQR
jgi:MbtH protein